MCHSRRAGRQTCLGQDVPDMPVDGMLAELEVRRGFFIAETTCDELEHLDLARRETAKFGDWADRSMRLEVELLEEDANGCRVSYSPQLVKRRAGTTKSETRRLSAAECEQRVGELQPGSGRLERCAVPFEERGALLEPRARLVVLSFSGKKKAICVGDRGFEWLGSDYCRYRAQLFESDSGRIQVALRDSCTDQDIQTRYPLRSILRRNAAEIFLGEIGSFSQLPAIERQRRAAQQPEIVGAGSREE